MHSNRLYSSDTQDSQDIWNVFDEEEPQLQQEQYTHEEDACWGESSFTDFELVGEEEVLDFDKESSVENEEYTHLLSQREFGGQDIQTKRLGQLAMHSSLRAESVLIRERVSFPDFSNIRQTITLRSPSTLGDIYSVMDRMEYLTGTIILAQQSMSLRREKIAQLKQEQKRKKQSIKPLKELSEFPLRISLCTIREAAVMTGNPQRYQYKPEEDTFHLKYLFSGEMSLQWCVRTLHAQQVLHTSLKQGGNISKRDLYYSLTRLFGTQSASDTTLAQLQSQLVCPRHILGFHAAIRTLVYGSVQVHVIEETSLVCREYPRGVASEWKVGIEENERITWQEERKSSIPNHILRSKRHLLGIQHFSHPRGIPDISPHTVIQQVSLKQAQEWVFGLQASFQQQQEWYEQQSVQHEIVFSGKAVLIVEKDTVFEVLRQQAWFPHNDVLLLTARGYPNVSARQFLLQIHKQYPKVPFYIVVDPDVDGLHIFQQYKYGSPNQVLDAAGALPAHLLGAKQEDIALLQLQGEPLSERDKKLGARLIKLCRTVNNTDIATQLKLLLKANTKVEQENIPDLPLYIRSLLQCYVM